MRATILAILLAAGAMILGLAIGLIISGIISGLRQLRDIGRDPPRRRSKLPPERRIFMGMLCLDH
jgi:hypothetical protein